MAELLSEDLHVQDEREAVLRNAAALIREGYVFPEIADALSDEIGARIEEWLCIDNRDAFIRAVNAALMLIANDKHLELAYRDRSGTPHPSPEADNFGIGPVELLVSGVGVLRLTRFQSLANPLVAEKALRAVDEAFSELRAPTVLIIDLRDNEGGDGWMVRYITSYLFGPNPVHLADYHLRNSEKPIESWTLAVLPKDELGREVRLADVPIFVLVNPATFSAAEEFAYNLRALKRATVIGEQTKGGAHPSRWHSLGAGFAVRLPYAETINPHTKTNWEGIGIEPDIATSSNSIDECVNLIERELRRRNNNDEAKGTTYE